MDKPHSMYIILKVEKQNKTKTQANTNLGTAKMAQQLKPFIALPDNLCSDLKAHIRILQQPLTPDIVSSGSAGRHCTQV